MEKEIDFRPYTGEAYIVFCQDDGVWWAERLIGFLQIFNDELSSDSFWVPAYCGEGYVQSAQKPNYNIVFNRKPTREDAFDVKNGHIIDFIGGELNLIEEVE